MVCKVDLNKTTFADLLARVQDTKHAYFSKNRLEGGNECQLDGISYSRMRLICQTLSGCELDNPTFMLQFRDGYERLS